MQHNNGGVICHGDFSETTKIPIPLKGLLRDPFYHGGFNFQTLLHLFITGRLLLPRQWPLLPNSIRASKDLWKVAVMVSVQWLTLQSFNYFLEWRRPSIWVNTFRLVISNH